MQKTLGNCCDSPAERVGIGDDEGVSAKLGELLEPHGDHIGHRIGVDEGDVSDSVGLNSLESFGSMALTDRYKRQDDVLGALVHCGEHEGACGQPGASDSV